MESSDQPSPYQKDFTTLETRLNLDFPDKQLLTQAFVHRSFLNENRDFPINHNERLEFLGDAVLELVVTEYLYINYENPEGELTNWRASLVNSQMLASIAVELELEQYLYLSKGEEKDTSSKARFKILANTVESLIGSMYLQFGFDTCKKFIGDILLSKLENILKNKLYLDPKTYFQETAQEKMSTTPTYKVMHEEGPDHDKKFTVAVFLDREQVAEGVGSSKQEAQVNAAHRAIETKGW